MNKFKYKQFIYIVKKKNNEITCSLYYILQFTLHITISSLLQQTVVQTSAYDEISNMFTHSQYTYISDIWLLQQNVL